MIDDEVRDREDGDEDHRARRGEAAEKREDADGRCPEPLRDVEAREVDGTIDVRRLGREEHGEGWRSEREEHRGEEPRARAEGPRSARRMKEQVELPREKDPGPRREKEERREALVVLHGAKHLPLDLGMGRDPVEETAEPTEGSPARRRTR